MVFSSSLIKNMVMRPVGRQVGNFGAGRVLGLASGVDQLARRGALGDGWK